MAEGSRRDRIASPDHRQHQDRTDGDGTYGSSSKGLTRKRSRSESGSPSASIEELRGPINVEHLLERQSKRPKMDVDQATFGGPQNGNDPARIQNRRENGQSMHGGEAGSNSIPDRERLASIIRPVTLHHEGMYPPQPVASSSSSVNHSQPHAAPSDADGQAVNSVAAADYKHTVSSESTPGISIPISSTSSSLPSSSAMPAFRPASMPALSNLSNLSSGQRRKGKGRASGENGLMELSRSNGQPEVNALAMESLEPPTGLKREEVVRVMLQALRDMGYSQSANALEIESGYEEEPPVALALKSAVLNGRWSEVIQILVELGVISEVDRKTTLRKSSSSNSIRNSTMDITMTSSTSGPTSSDDNAALVDSSDASSSSEGKRALFMILRQKYLELLELGQTKRALVVLRSELAPLASHTSRLHALSGFMVCVDKHDLYERAKWDGAGGSSRKVLLHNLQQYVAPGLMLPSYRLGALFNQAQKYQESRCLYHNGGPTSLLGDHQCQRGVLPTVTTHILAEHTDEVWTIAFSADGRELASGGKDGRIILWSIEDPPTRTCKMRRAILHPLTHIESLAWSKDGSHLVAIGDSVIYVYDAKTRDGALRNSWSTTGLRVNDFVVTPDSSTLVAVAASASTIRRDGLDQPYASRLLEKLTTGATSSSQIPIGLMDHVLAVYKLGSEAHHSRTSLSLPCQNIALSADGKAVLLHSHDDEIQLWSLLDREPRFVRKYTGHMHRSYHIGVAFGGSPTNQNLIVAPSEDRHVYIWHRDSGALMEILEGHHKLVNAVAWHPKHAGLFASCSDDHTIRIWQPPSVAEANARAPTQSTTVPVESPIANGHGDSAASLPSAPVTNSSSSERAALNAPQTTTSALPTISPSSPIDFSMDMDTLM